MSDDLRKLAEAATPGPWSQSPDNHYEVWANYGQDGESFICGNAGSDAAYIAAVPPDVVLGLLDRVEQAEAREWTLRAALEQYGRHLPGCVCRTGMAQPCTCGFADALAAAPAPEEGR